MNITYIAFLRGINIGGHNVKMERLRELFTELGLVNVRSYIQSGNVFFDSDEADREKLAAAIEQQLHQALGYTVPVFLRTIPELEHILALDPFKNLDITADMRLCVVFTADKIPNDLALPFYSPKHDMAIIKTTDHEAFVVWYIINGRPPADQGFLKKIIGEKNTTRFWHTTAKILQAAKQT